MPPTSAKAVAAAALDPRTSRRQDLRAWRAAGIITAILLGIVEGLTEFMPVSSTGHLILASELLGYSAETWATFNVIIQLGAILAVIVLYWRTFWDVMTGLMRARRGVVAVRAQHPDRLPAVGGAGLHPDRSDRGAAGQCLGGGGGADRRRHRDPDHRAAGEAGRHRARRAAMPVRTALGIGIIQCLSMVPGVSRSGATIMGALSLGVERRTAAEFSFFLAVPTMVGATSLSVVKHRDEIASGAVDWGLIAIGFAVSFMVAMVVIKAFIGIVSRYGFAPFAWYRIVAGRAALWLPPFWPSRRPATTIPSMTRRCRRRWPTMKIGTMRMTAAAIRAAIMMAGYDQGRYDQGRGAPPIVQPGQVEAMGGAMDRLVGAVMSLPIGGIAAAVDPYNRGGIHPNATVRDMATRDDPYAEERMRAGIRGATRGVGAMGQALARAMPVLERSIREVEREMEAAMDQVDRGPR
jgi:undecaprenyl-diphosphatase